MGKDRIEVIVWLKLYHATMLAFSNPQNIRWGLCDDRTTFQVCGEGGSDVIERHRYQHICQPDKERNPLKISAQETECR